MLMHLEEKAARLGNNSRVAQATAFRQPKGVEFGHETRAPRLVRKGRRVPAAFAF